MQAYFDDFDLTVVYSGVDITFDRFYNIENTDSDHIDTEERNIKLGDSAIDSDVGAFKVGTTRTSGWNRYGKSEGISIQQLYGQNILESYSAYKNSTRVQIVDPTDSIKPHNALTIDSKDYKLIGYKVSYVSGSYKKVNAEVEEILNSAVNSSTTLTPLDTVDGKDTGSENVTSALLILDDGNISTASTWSSDKIDSEIDSKISTGQKWTDKSSDIYRNSKIGVGDFSSEGIDQKLTIKQTAASTLEDVFGVMTNAGSNRIKMTVDASNRPILYLTDGSGGESIRLYGGNESFFMGDVGFGINNPSTGYIDIYNKILRTRGGGQILTRQQTAGVAQTLLNVQNSAGGARAFFQLDTSNFPTFTMRDSGGTSKIFIRPDSTCYFTGSTKVAIGKSTATYALDVTSFRATAASYFTSTLDVTGDFTAADIEGTEFTIPSDRRLKKNIKPIRGASKILRSLEGVTYDIKKTNKKSIGYIAQDVGFNLAVKRKSDGYLKLNYTAFIPLLTEGWKDHDTRINLLDNKIVKGWNSYDRKIKALEKRVKELEALGS
jgi:hypothetical protein